MSSELNLKQKLDDQTNIDKYGVGTNITDYHIISKLILLRIIIPKYLKIRQLFHVKNVCKMLMIIELFRFLS